MGKKVSVRQQKGKKMKSELKPARRKRKRRYQTVGGRDKANI